MPWALFCPLVVVKARLTYDVFHWTWRSGVGWNVRFARVPYLFWVSFASMPCASLNDPDTK